MTGRAEEPSSLLDWVTDLASDPVLRTRFAEEPRSVLDEQGLSDLPPADLHHSLPLVTDSVAARLGTEVDVAGLGAGTAQLAGEDPVLALVRQLGAVTETVDAGSEGLVDPPDESSGTDLEDLDDPDDGPEPDGDVDPGDLDDPADLDDVGDHPAPTPLPDAGAHHDLDDLDDPAPDHADADPGPVDVDGTQLDEVGEPAPASATVLFPAFGDATPPTTPDDEEEDVTGSGQGPDVPAGPDTADEPDEPSDYADLSVGPDPPAHDLPDPDEHHLDQGGDDHDLGHLDHLDHQLDHDDPGP